MAVAGRMEINASGIGAARVLVVTGDVDLSNVNVFIERLFELSANGDQKIVLDMTGVEFIDSTVINALFASAARIRAHDGDMAIVLREGSPAARALDLSGADAIYALVQSHDEALESLGVTHERRL
jgi:anti-anti-sigma factor